MKAYGVAVLEGRRLMVFSPSTMRKTLNPTVIGISQSRSGSGGDDDAPPGSARD
jgi:hypothetical protein